MNQLSRSENHAAARHKRITGSRVIKIMTGGPAAWDTLSEMLHNPEPEIFYSLENTPNMPEQMRRGLEFEPMAIAEFLFRHEEYEIEEGVFFIPGDNFGDEDLRDWIGVSADAKLSLNSGLETKVPSMEKHLAWKEAGALPPEYLPQCALSLLVTGAESWWFSSFCPELEGDERYFDIKLEREEIYLDLMKSKIRQFLEGHKAHKLFAEPAIEQEVIPASSFPIVQFGITDEAIAVLVEEYGSMVTPTTSSEYAVVKAANLDLVKRRTGIEKVYKKAIEEAKDYIDGVRGEKKRLLGLLLDTEAHTKQLRATWEDEQQRIKDEAIAKEERRVESIRSLIEWMNVTALSELHGLNSKFIATQIETYEAMEIMEETYNEFLDEGLNAKVALITRAKQLLEKVTAQEVETVRVETEQRELRERNEQLERENQERQAREAKENRERLEREATQKAEQERLKEIHDRIAEIKSAVMDAMDGTLQEAEMVLARLNASEECVDELFQERVEEAKPLFEKVIKSVEKIIIDKRIDAAASARVKALQATTKISVVPEEGTFAEESEPETPPEALYPLINYANDILQYAHHLRDEIDWLVDRDRERLKQISNDIEVLSDEVQERIESNG